MQGCQAIYIQLPIELASRRRPHASDGHQIQNACRDRRFQFLVVLAFTGVYQFPDLLHSGGAYAGDLYQLILLIEIMDVLLDSIQNPGDPAIRLVSARVIALYLHNIGYTFKYCYYFCSCHIFGASKSSKPTKPFHGMSDSIDFDGFDKSDVVHDLHEHS